MRKNTRKSKNWEYDMAAPEGMLWCRLDQEYHPEDEFWINNSSPSGKFHSCRLSDRARRYGMTRYELIGMYSLQNSLCAHCLEAKALHVDHCHDSGEVRVLLCQDCNHAEGNLPNHTRAYKVFWETVAENMMLWKAV